MENFKNKIKNSLNAIKIFATSLFFLVVGYFFFKGVSKNNKENSTNIKTDENLKKISSYDEQIDVYNESINDITEKISVIKNNIEEIKKEEPKKTTLDEFFDERVK